MKTGRAEAPLSILSLSDGRAGNAVQARGLAEAIARLTPAEISVQEAPLRGPAAALPAGLSHRLARLSTGWLKLAHERLPAGRWDLVIGAGRRVAPLVAALRRPDRRAVQLLDPQMPPSAFDLVIAPEHDGLRGPNLLSSVGALGTVNPARIAAEAQEWAGALAHLPAGRRLAVLLGGPGAMARWTPEDEARLVAALGALAAEGWTLLATASRRTDPGLIGALGGVLEEGRHFLYSLRGANPYPAILGLAEAVLVTEDSVNMTCEAGASGLPVHVWRLEGATPKARAFHDSLARRGVTRDFDGRIGRWPYRPLAEADRLAPEVLSRLFPARARG